MSARPTPFCASPLPLQIGKYRVTGLIGEGAMGVVYRAQDPDIRRSVAIKTIRPPLRVAEDCGGPPASRQFRREAQAAGRLNHANIVSIYECGECGELDAGGESGPRGESDRQLFIAMECVDGPSLAGLMRQGARLDLADVLAVMLQVLDALQCAHDQGVWHCDIKPSNLLLTPDGRIKVTDFGIARLGPSDLTVRHAVWGSPGYMAPERYAGGAIDQRVDLFSCGVLLYELLAGSPPFVGSPGSIMYQVLQKQAPPPSTLPGSLAAAALDTVVLRALAKQPGDRFLDAPQMRTALLDAASPARAARRLSTRAMNILRGPDTAGSATTPSASPAGAQASSLSPTVTACPAPDAETAAVGAVAMEQLEALLRPRLGPISRLVVREAARDGVDLPGMAMRIAATALQPEERSAFQAQVQALPQVRLPDPPRTGSWPHTGPMRPALCTPLRPEVVARATRILTRELGPIGPLLARRAAAASSGQADFYGRLADLAAETVDPQWLLRQFARIS